MTGGEFERISIPFYTNLGLYSSNDSEIPLLWHKIINFWLNSDIAEGVILEKIDEKHWHICMEKVISTIDIDISVNPENDVFRWQENRAKSTSNNAVDFGKQDLESILIDYAVSIPDDARCVGISRTPEGLLYHPF
ncbi:MAG TPA: hypothetical protein VHO70_02370 [Chitinispirillaceae bacterium]|nr:hypothetical protein [Chitinispirillaceae bacterium]